MGVADLPRTQIGRPFLHVHALHPDLITQVCELVEHATEEAEVCLEMGSEIVGVPPQVVILSFDGSDTHAISDPTQAQAIEMSAGSGPRTQESTRRDIDRPSLGGSRSDRIGSRQRKIRIQQANSAALKGLIRRTPGPIQPARGGTAKDVEPGAWKSLDVRLIILIAREDDTAERQTTALRYCLCGLEIGNELNDGLAGFETVVVRKRVTPHFLPRRCRDLLDQRRRVVERVVLFVGTDICQPLVRRKPAV
jgi:hypothetical protein